MSYTVPVPRRHRGRSRPGWGSTAIGIAILAVMLFRQQLSAAGLFARRSRSAEAPESA